MNLGKKDVCWTKCGICVERISFVECKLVEMTVQNCKKCVVFHSDLVNLRFDCAK